MNYLGERGIFPCGSLPRDQEEENRNNKVNRQELDALIPVGLSAACDEGGNQNRHEDKGELSTSEGKDKRLRRCKQAEQNEQRLPGN